MTKNLPPNKRASDDALAVVPPRTALIDVPAADPKKPMTSKMTTHPSSQRGSKSTDLSAPELYLNRELTWLAFNWRVLSEVRAEQTPLLEKVKFLAIVSSNLDEFFMKRIGGLKQQIGAGFCKPTVDGRTPIQQVTECNADIRLLVNEKAVLAESVTLQLRGKGISLVGYKELTRSELHKLRTDYEREVLPLVTPLGLDSAHPFPLISNLSLNLLVLLREKSGNEFLARVKVPISADSSRFTKIGNEHRYIPLEEVMAHNLDLLFPDCLVVECQIFRVTRNASAERNEEAAEDLLAMIEAELRDRKFAPSVRLEVSPGMSASLKLMLADKLGIDPIIDIFEDRGLLGMADLMQLAHLEVPHLHDAPHYPVTNECLRNNINIFEAIRAHGSILLQFPKESFATSVERFVTTASKDPKVLVIKATLYRTSANSGIVESLARAARAGKHVAVMVELKARFDEAANVGWARHLEESGAHVSYGVVGFKTHCKAILVIRREQSKLVRYVHVGTGNYHAGTARLYVDFGLLSCNKKLSEDVADLFNSLTSGRHVERSYHKILTAPKTMKNSLLHKIAREARLHSVESRGRIRLKTNALEDPDIVKALYLASRAGVRIELFVRDTCRLRPGLAEISQNIVVISTVSRFLEHSRIYYFRNGGQDEYLIGSADLMQRSLEHRIELLVPVEERRLQTSLRNYLDQQLANKKLGWVMQSDGKYTKRF